MEQHHRQIGGSVLAVILAVFGSIDNLEQFFRIAAFASATIVSVATFIGMMRTKRKNRRNRHY